MKGCYVEVKAEIDRGCLRVRGDIHIPKIDIGFMRAEIFDNFKKMDVDSFKKYLARDYICELESHISNTTENAKSEVLEIVQRRIYQIFNFEGDK